MYACIYAPDAGNHLVEVAASFSPTVEAAKDHVLIDVRGLGALFGGPHQIAERIAGRVKANVAIASTPEAARIAACGISGVTVMLPGEEAKTLAPLSVALLTMDETILDTLAGWGIRTFGDFAGLPEMGIAERFGPEGVRLHRLARGITTRPLTMHRDRPPFSACMDLEHALDSLEPLSFVLSRLLHEVCDQLAFESLATNELRLELALDNKSTFSRTLLLPFPTRETATFLRLLQYDLAAHPPQAAIERVTLAAEPVHGRVVQHGLFIPLAPQPEKLELTLARVSAIVGEENVGSPELLDTHQPGAFQMVRFDASHRQPKGGEAETQPRLAVRLFRPPLPATITFANGRLMRIRARGMNGSIVAYAGPWRTSGGWWTPAAWHRDEWDIEVEGGALYRIYREGENGWYVDGNYD